MQLKKLSIVFSILVLAALACATLAGGGTEDQALPDSSQPGESSGGEGLQPETGGAATATPGSSGDSPGSQGDGPSEDGPDEPVAPGSSIDLDNPGLYNQYGGLESYRTTLLNTFEGVDAAGQPVTGTVFMSGATQVEPYESTLSFFSAGRAVVGSGEVFTFTQILETQYIVYTGLPCISDAPGGQENPFEIMLDGGGMLTGTADFIEDEMVNGVETHAYKITEENIDTVDPAGSGVENLSKGRLNIAADGGYVVRLILEGSGTNELLSLDPGLEGEIYYELNYLDFNQPVDIQVPKTCQADTEGEYGYPMPEDASEINRLGDFLTFKTGLSVSEATAFYQTEMQALGCSEGQELGSQEGLILTFSGCPAGGAQVVLAPEGEGTAVTILATP